MTIIKFDIRRARVHGVNPTFYYVFFHDAKKIGKEYYGRRIGNIAFITGDLEDELNGKLYLLSDWSYLNDDHFLGVYYALDIFEDAIKMEGISYFIDRSLYGLLLNACVYDIEAENGKLPNEQIFKFTTKNLFLLFREVKGLLI